MISLRWSLRNVFTCDGWKQSLDGSEGAFASWVLYFIPWWVKTEWSCPVSLQISVLHIYSRKHCTLGLKSIVWPHLVWHFESLRWEEEIWLRRYLVKQVRGMCQQVWIYLAAIKQQIYSSLSNESIIWNLVKAHEYMINHYCVLSREMDTWWASASECMMWFWWVLGGL